MKTFFPKTLEFIYSMVTVAIMAGSALLNAVAFTGGNYLAGFLSSDEPEAALKEKIKTRQSSPAVTKPRMPNTRKNEQSCLTGSKSSTKRKNWPTKTSRTPTTSSSSSTGCIKMSRKRSSANYSSTSPVLCQNKAG